MTTDELDRYLTIAKKHNLKSLKANGFEFVFGDEPAQELTLPDKPTMLTQPTAPTTEDNMLLWSTPFYDEGEKK